MEWHHGNQGSLERLLPDGRWVLITERQNPTGGIVGIRTDITIIKQTLAELAEANERASQAVEEVRLQNLTLTERDQELRVRNMLFTAALNNMSQGLLMVDSDRRVNRLQQTIPRHVPYYRTRCVARHNDSGTVPCN